MSNLKKTEKIVSEVIDDYFKAIGGKERVNQIKSLYTLVEEKVEGQDFKLTKINKRDRMNLMIIELSMNGNPVQKIEFYKDSVFKVIQRRNIVSHFDYR